jgi:hypothetical protein
VLSGAFSALVPFFFLLLLSSFAPHPKAHKTRAVTASKAAARRILRMYFIVISPLKVRRPDRADRLIFVVCLV